MIGNWRNALLLLSLACGLSSAQTFDRAGRSEVLGEPQPDWVLVGSSLVDVVDDEFLGLVGVSAGFTGNSFMFSADNRFMFTPESFYSRGTRGERTDTLTIVDTSTLAAVGEVIIPSKLALMGPIVGATALLDDGRYLAVFNLTPASSLSIVDVIDQTFVGEISTPGCSLAYAAGELRYVMLCANGGILTVSLNADGSERSRERTEGFFDAEADPIRESSVRYRDQWLFVSFDGVVHPLDIADAGPQFGETWSLLTADDRRDNWRIAGRQHLAVHEATGRLYSMVRQSEEPIDDPADMDGTEIWVYDLATRQRVQRLEAIPERADADGDGGGGGIGSSSGDGASNILVTQGDAPLLITVGGGVSVRDALSGDYIHETLNAVSDGGYLTPMGR